MAHKASIFSLKVMVKTLWRASVHLELQNSLRAIDLIMKSDASGALAAFWHLGASKGLTGHQFANEKSS